MANASARRSFHGPLQTTRRCLAHERRAAPARPLELAPATPGASPLGRALLLPARAETPTTSERQRILASVLDALQRLTGAGR
jgi:hypothetical protein